MRHRRANRKLGKATDQRLAMLSAIVRSLFLQGRVRVTLSRAKQARRLAEKMIAVSKKNNLNARRKVESFFGERKIVSQVFKTFPERFEGRAGGFTRIVKAGFRKGDAAPMAILELI
jgi:large subunit ribosomal protein L17